MYGQIAFEPSWKSRYMQMLISCGVDREEAFKLLRCIGLIEASTQNDVCILTQEQASVALTKIKEIDSSWYESSIPRLSDYIEWRRLFEPYGEHPLQKNEILNSKEMKEIKDAPLTPEELESIILTALGNQTINIAAPCLCLAWMGYEAPDMVQLKEKDVDFSRQTLRGVHVPDPLWRVFKRYHETDSERIFNNTGMRLVYKLPGDWLIKSTDSKKTTAECQVDAIKIVTSVRNVSKKYRQVVGVDRKITVRLTQTAGMLYRLYEPWDDLTDEQFVNALRFRGRSYDTYQMQSWRKKITAYCFLREEKAT